MDLEPEDYDDDNYWLGPGFAELERAYRRSVLAERDPDGFTPDDIDSEE